MLNKGIDKLGDWNPQLLRELKGRLKGRNIAIALIISLVGQFLLFFSWSGDHSYLPRHLTEQEIQLWWQDHYRDIFISLSLVILFALLVVAVIVLPPTLLSVLSIVPGQNWGGLWLFTAFPWDYVMRHASVGLVLQTFLIQVIILGGLNWQLRRQLRLAGESATKALLAGRSPLFN
ncbi:MAG: hypothetical protein RIG63_07870 [Coleofasciculus chthonoplastes F3-SA18-01]|uniref:hypothetical protein n=1 Tax=Coleofasciculus chthonoplastes TaxID=64178 RepID=UPI0032F602C9